VRVRNEQEPFDVWLPGNAISGSRIRIFAERRVRRNFEPSLERQINGAAVCGLASSRYLIDNFGHVEATLALSSLVGFQSKGSWEFDTEDLRCEDLV
jgi:hypothetical protein